MYQKILVPVDGSAESERALQEAVHLARLIDSRLVLLHVVDAYHLLLTQPTTASFDEARQACLESGQALLDQHADSLEASGLPFEAVLREVLSNRVSSAILDEASRRQCGLIVMGMHGRNGRTRLSLGSDAEHVVRASMVPVLLVRAGAAAS
ncbi:universal stress protein [Azohydromonas aeria]|uniref:universal stress protein n=1 Tax=Azohydromonas aeria TaxID=2590212 RepID=UPI0012F89A25|nr:universal stress protein [Azohydromonas aeria]